MPDAGRSDFYDYPDLYDVLLSVGAHAPFYVDMARQQGGAVLELACGTGQLTIPIALQGLPTVGLDQSSVMLADVTWHKNGIFAFDISPIQMSGCSPDLPANAFPSWR